MQENKGKKNPTIETQGIRRRWMMKRVFAADLNRKRK